MDMDSSQNWLAFSISNPHLPSDSSHLCLFEAFTTSNSGGENRTEESASRAFGGAAADLRIISRGGPKLEDFLGGCGGDSGGLSADVGHLRGETTTTTTAAAAGSGCGTEIYDSELKTIAASFLRGFYTEQNETQKQLAVVPPPEPTVKKAIETFGQRTSIYRGVTRHRWTGRYEAHLWDNSCRREGQSRKGRQVYLGGYDKEEKAARAYDLAALKYWGPATTTNFPVSNYEKELEEMKNMTRQEFVAALRRKSSGFSRGASIYRGVTRHHQHGRWQARIGRVAGNKDLYLGTFSTQEEAAEAYDIAAIKFRGLNAVTNFDMSRYDVKSIISSTLPIGGMAGKSKTSSESTSSEKVGTPADLLSNDSKSSFTYSSASSQPPPPSLSSLSFGLPVKLDQSDFWSVLGYNATNTTTPHSNNAVKAPTGSTIGSLFQSSANGSASTSQNNSNVVPFSMGFTGASGHANETNTSAATATASIGGGFSLSGGYLNNNQSNCGGGAATSVPVATPIVADLDGTNSGYGGSIGSWTVQSSIHTFQPAKPNLSVFQTPIFGME